MSRYPRPLRGYFAALTSAGYIWTETICWRAKDSRRKCGEMFVGIKNDRGNRVTDAVAGWAEARRRGYRLIKVDVTPAGNDL